MREEDTNVGRGRGKREEERKRERQRMRQKGKRKKSRQTQGQRTTVNELQQAKIETATVRGREDRQRKGETD